MHSLSLACPKCSKSALSNIYRIPKELHLQFSLYQENSSYFLVFVNIFLKYLNSFCRKQRVVLWKWFNKLTFPKENLLIGFMDISQKTVHGMCWWLPSIMQLIKYFHSLVKLLTAVVEIFPLPSRWKFVQHMLIF